MVEPISVGVVLTAAGNSSRMGKNIKKEFLPLSGGSVLSAAALVFFKAAQESARGDNPFTLARMIVTVPAAEESAAREALSSLPLCAQSLITYAPGGSTRQKSAFNGMRLLALDNPKIVLIHDGARPWLSADLVRKVVDGAARYGACAPAIVPTDTQKTIDDDGFIAVHLERAKTRAVQTPQGFCFDAMLLAHERAASSARTYTDDTEIWALGGGRVFLCEGEEENKKITFPRDLPTEAP